jgi:hypothetical protein
MSDDSEELVLKAVTGTAQGKTGTHTLYLVEWDDFPNSIDFMREPRDNFGEHAALTDAFVIAWRAAGKPWPPAPSCKGSGQRSMGHRRAALRWLCAGLGRSAGRFLICPE